MLGLIIRLLIAAWIHIYRGSTGPLQAQQRSGRSQLFCVGLGIALFSLLLTLLQVPMSSMAILVGLVTTAAGYLKPHTPQIERVDGCAATKVVEL